MKAFIEQYRDVMPHDWPTEGLERVESCPICGSARRSNLYTGLQDKAFRCAPGRWDLYQCQRCESTYLDPRPTVSSIGLAYSNYFTHAKILNTDDLNLSWAHNIRRRLANGYRNYRFGTNLRPASRLGIVAAMLLPKQRRLIDFEGRYLPAPKLGMRLLDVGCGNAVFLSLARSLGWDVVGVEPDPKAVEAARSRGIDVRHGGVDILDPEKESFDGITLSHVIEHVHDPVAVLQSCYALLKPGGWIWLETPNIKAQGHEKYGSNWRGLEPPRHLVLFTRASLKLAMEQVGFQEIEDQPYRPLCQIMFTTSDAIANHNNPSTVTDISKDGWREVRAMERKAKFSPELREFITFKASKSLY